MSRGQSQPRAQSTRRTIERCKSKTNIDNVCIIDVEKGKIDVVIVDAPESSCQRTRCSWAAAKRNEKYPSSGVISIDDEVGGDDAGLRNADSDSTSSKTFRLSSNSHLSEGSDSDECLMFVGKGKFSSEFKKNMTMYPKIGSSRNVFGLKHASECSTSEGEMSESDVSDCDSVDSAGSDGASSDCEIIDDSSGNAHEEWEKAALKKKMKRDHFGSMECASASGSDTDPRTPCETTQKTVGFKNTTANTYSVQSGAVPVHSNASTSSKGSENIFTSTNIADGFKEDSSLKSKGKFPVGDSDCTFCQISHERPCSHNKDELISEKPFLPRTQSQAKIPFGHNCTKSCVQDMRVPEPFACNTQMQHDTYRKNDGVSFMDKEDFSWRTSVCPVELHEKSQDEDMAKFGKPYPCDTQSCDGTRFLDRSNGLQDTIDQVPSQSASDTQTRNFADVTHEMASFQYLGRSSSLEPNKFNSGPQDEAWCNMERDHSVGEEEAVTRGTLSNLIKRDGTSGTIVPLKIGNTNAILDGQNVIIGDREKHKESDEYRRAAEEEWASRQRQVQLQAEEAQRLRKKKKAESLRLLDMEKRQKQRVEEMRECQKRDEETINLKEQFRAEIRKELYKLELKYRDMASLLRGLGINVGGGSYPMSHEVNAAYKQALLRFHPDRASRTDIRQQVEAEEKFKLISRLKEKLLPVA